MNDLIPEDFLKVFMAGGIGAILSLAFMPEIGWKKTIMIVLGGAFAAVYLTPWTLAAAGKFITVSASMENGAAFITGVLGMFFIGGIVKLGQAFRDNPNQIIKKGK